MRQLFFNIFSATKEMVLQTSTITIILAPQGCPFWAPLIRVLEIIVAKVSFLYNYGAIFSACLPRVGGGNEQKLSWDSCPHKFIKMTSFGSGICQRFFSLSFPLWKEAMGWKPFRDLLTFTSQQLLHNCREWSFQVIVWIFTEV